MVIFADREDPDEMLKNKTFHQRLHCLLRQKTILGTKNVITCVYQNIQWIILNVLVKCIDLQMAKTFQNLDSSM